MACQNFPVASHSVTVPTDGSVPQAIFSVTVLRKELFEAVKTTCAVIVSGPISP